MNREMPCVFRSYLLDNDNSLSLETVVYYSRSIIYLYIHIHDRLYSVLKKGFDSYNVMLQDIVLAGSFTFFECFLLDDLSQRCLYVANAIAPNSTLRVELLL